MTGSYQRAISVTRVSYTETRVAHEITSVTLSPVREVGCRSGPTH